MFTEGITLMRVLNVTLQDILLFVIWW